MCLKLNLSRLLHGAMCLVNKATEQNSNLWHLSLK